MKSINLLRIIFVQSFLAMMGSLYFSNFGDPIANMQHGHFFSGNGFEPCDLCRWTRILMYPLVWFTLVGLFRKDTKVVYTILPVSFAGIVLTSYQYIIQYVNSLSVFNCAPGTSCSLIDWQIFGVLTIPGLARIAFVVIFIFSLLIIKNKK